MALTLANMLARVKRNVPTTTMDTELQDSLLERMNYLVSLDTFPFQEKYQSSVLAAGAYLMTTPDNFANLKSIVCWITGEENDITILGATEFSRMFPKPDENAADYPSYCCIRVAEGEIWFDCPASAATTIRMEFYAIPDDATDATVSQMIELAKLALIRWASADGFRMMQEHDRADKFEDQGNKFLGAMKIRYQLAMEKDAGFISPQKAHALRRT